MRALSPAQLVGVPDKVSTKVSQFTPSTQVLSSSEEPPVAVPTQFTAGPVGPSVPELGVAERKPVVKRTNAPRKTPITKKARRSWRARSLKWRFFSWKGLIVVRVKKS